MAFLLQAALLQVEEKHLQLYALILPNQNSILEIKPDLMAVLDKTPQQSINLFQNLY